MADETAYGYCTADSIMIGDIMLPPEISPSAYITSTAEEMDSRLSQIYEVPIQIDATDLNKFRGTITILRSINSRLATGRLIMAAAAALENVAVHAYARQMVTEALVDLDKIVERKIILQGAKANDNVNPDFTVAKVVVGGQDDLSAVDGFYQFVDPQYSTPKSAFMQLRLPFLP